MNFHKLSASAIVISSAFILTSCFQDAKITTLQKQMLEYHNSTHQEVIGSILYFLNNLSYDDIENVDLVDDFRNALPYVNKSADFFASLDIPDYRIELLNLRKEMTDNASVYNSNFKIYEMIKGYGPPITRMMQSDEYAGQLGYGLANYLDIYNKFMNDLLPENDLDLPDEKDVYRMSISSSS